MFASLRLCIAAGALAATAAIAPAFARDATPIPPPATSLTISGAVEHALTLRVADLRAYPPAQIIELRLAGSGGADSANTSVVRGVRLRDLVDQANLVKRDHNTVKKLAIIATASDNYKAVFSWNELFNAELGDSVLVVFELDGKPLAAEEGPLALISAKDLRTGPRHVKWLQAVEVRQIAE